MIITFKLFASARDKIGQSSITFEAEELYLSSFIKILQSQHQNYDFSICSFAKGGEYIDKNSKLNDNDIIFVIPPVSGG